MEKKASQSGFTLIELIAVMVILGILAAVIIPRISTITSGAYESNVRAMYGVIKNEVNAQALKAAMSGGAQGHLERYPNPSVTTVDYYLDQWVDDYDPDMWSSFQIASVYPNTTNGSGSNTHAVLFMYHPHGEPNAAIAITTEGDGATKTKNGTATSYEDIYWIYYAPRTSNEGAAAGRTLDSFVMGAWSNAANDWTFDGRIDADGSITDRGDDPITDLSYISNPD